MRAQVVDVFHAADYFAVAGLLTVCNQHLTHTATSTETVANMLSLTATLPHAPFAPGLRASAVKYAAKRSAEVMQTRGWKELIAAGKVELISEVLEAVTRRLDTTRRKRARSSSYDRQQELNSSDEDT